jgi:tRNA (uracil-5-)-methyltransferase
MSISSSSRVYRLTLTKQAQPLSYETQLDLKRTVVVKAYKNFSGKNFPYSIFCANDQIELPESSIPAIGTTVPSPLEYGYRTKITPHFDPPPKKLRDGVYSPDEPKPEWLKIGFNQVGKRQVMDIEVGNFSPFGYPK